MSQGRVSKRVHRLTRSVVRRVKRLTRGTHYGRGLRDREVAAIMDDLILSPSRRAAFYRFAGVMTLLMERAGIRYSAFAGTMLGSVRHGGMIPWDDDLDFVIPEADVPMLVRLLDEIESYGIRRNLRLVDDPGIFQFMPFGAPIMGDETGYMALDVFVLSEAEVEGVGLVWHHRSEFFRKHFPRQWVRPEEVFPRRRYDFGPLQLWGMGDPSGYLERSGFNLHAATLKSHKARRQATNAAVKRLKAIDAYPVVVPGVVRMVPPYETFPVYELDAYRVS